MKEYRTLYFKDDKKGRESMQAEIDRLSQYGWQLSNTQAIDQGYGIGGSVLLGLAGKRKSQVMIVMERERNGNYPAEPEQERKLTREEVRANNRAAVAASTGDMNDKAAALISKVFPGYAKVWERQKARNEARSKRINDWSIRTKQKAKEREEKQRASRR
jgi:hypothetical protein